MTDNTCTTCHQNNHLQRYTNIFLLYFNAEVELWTKAGHIKIKIGKGCDVRAIDMLIANAVIG